jgi:hypothetical protein
MNEQPRRHNLLNALASIKLRRTQEENSPQPSSTERNREKTDTPIDHFVLKWNYLRLLISGFVWDPYIVCHAHY